VDIFFFQKFTLSQKFNMNRIDRISAILIQLQTKKYITSGEIAKRFEISPRTVYRDLKALEEAGVPVGAEPGKGFFLVDGFHLPPVMFTREEAGAMLVAEKMVEKFTDTSVNSHYQSAMFKIKSVLPDKEKQFISDLTGNIEILYSPQNAVPDNSIPIIQQALVNKQLLNIEYKSFSKDECTWRTIEPLGLCFYSFSWHLIGFCRLRNEYRDFRVDRIQSIHLCPEKFTDREKLTIRNYFKKYAESSDLIEVMLLFDKKMAEILHSVKYYYGFVGEEDKGDKVQMEFISNDLEYFSRWLLMYADAVEVIAPLELKKRMHDLVNTIKNRFA
jgi:predicted DNA-binding transcriptional regulator YafY